MKIPKTIEILGFTIPIKYRTKIVHKGELCDGLWDYATDTIYLRKGTKKDPFLKQDKELTFLHELTHAILDHSGQKKLSEDEEVVDRLSTILQQVLKQI